MELKGLFPWKVDDYRIMANYLDIQKDFKYVVEKEFEYLGYKCIALLRSTGFRYGYVGIPKEHPLYGKKRLDYCVSDDGERIMIASYLQAHHYGITYSSDEGKFDYLSDDLWWFGFNCHHLGDHQDIESVEKKFKDGKAELCKYVLSFSRPSMSGGMFCSEKYVINQCKRLADQLKCFEKK